MQGISQSKHQHLVDALLQLERLLNGDFTKDADKQLANELRLELEDMHRQYNKQVLELSALISEYHKLFHKTKTQFLSPKLKELRKLSPPNVKVIPALVENIRLVYGT